MLPSDEAQTNMSNCQRCGTARISGRYCATCAREIRQDSFGADSAGQTQPRRRSLKLYECMNCGHHYRAEALSKCSKCDVARCRVAAVLTDKDGERVPDGHQVTA